MSIDDVQEIKFDSISNDVLSQWSFKLSDWQTLWINKGVNGFCKSRAYRMNRITGQQYQIRFRRGPRKPKYLRRKMQNKSRS